MTAGRAASEGSTTEPSTTPTAGAGAAADGQRVGVLMGLAAYGLWGVFPLYFTVLDPAGPVEILLHRVVWTLLVCAVLLTVTRAWAGVRPVVRSGRALAMLSAAAVLIATNWLVYIFGVLSEQVVQTALGYYINPLVTVLLGVVVLRERLRPAQWVAVGIGAAAVAVLCVAYGGVPWIALTLALSFGLYGLLKNRVGRSVGAVHSLSVETAVLAPASLAAMVWIGLDGTATFTDLGLGHALPPGQHRRRHGDPVAAVRVVGPPGPAVDDRSAAVPHAHPAARHRRHRAGRADASRPLDRVRPGVARARRADRSTCCARVADGSPRLHLPVTPSSTARPTSPPSVASGPAPGVSARRATHESEPHP